MARGEHFSRHRVSWWDSQSRVTNERLIDGAVRIFQLDTETWKRMLRSGSVSSKTFDKFY